MAEDYWSKYWSVRTNRRRLLGGAGMAGTGIAALGLVGCGGGSNNNNSASNLATPTPKPGTQTNNDPFAGAKKGGTYNTTAVAEPPTIDPFGNLSYTTKSLAAFSYSRLMQYKTGPGIQPADVRPEPDGAEKMETSPDGLKYTFTIRKGLTFHNLPPVNGRAVTSDDVKYSWGRATAATNGNASRLTSVVDKVEYPDASTVVMTLKAPNVTIPDLMADTNLLFIMPAEAGSGGFDPSKTMIGSGPWIFQSYTPSVGFKFTKNPNWWNTGYPLMDNWNVAIIPDYPTRLAQFLAGNTDVEAPTSDDLVNVKNQLPDVQLFGTIAQLISFIFFDPDPNSPWAKDDRIRQAISMAQDRNALLELAYNLNKLKAAGLDVKGPWNNIIPAGMTRFWLDPQSKDQGDSAQYFKYDVANAKKLLSAAGLSDFSTTFQYSANAYGQTFNTQAEAILAYINAIGIKTTTDVQDYPSKYITQTFVGNFKGVAFGYETPFPEASGYPERMFTDNPNNHSKIKDAQLTSLTNQQLTETDEAKRKQIFWQIQQVNAQHMYYIPMPLGGGTTWSAAHSNVHNVYTFPTTGYGAATETVPYVWKS